MQRRSPLDNNGYVPYPQCPSQSTDRHVDRDAWVENAFPRQSYQKKDRYCAVKVCICVGKRAALEVEFFLLGASLIAPNLLHRAIVVVTLVVLIHSAAATTLEKELKLDQRLSMSCLAER